MADERARAGIELSMDVRGRGARRRPEAGEPFAILVIGDFGGRGATRPIRVDLDTFDALFERVAPELRIEPPGGPGWTIPFRSLDDFHPDRLYDELDLFADVRRLRREARDPSALPRVAAALGLGAVAATANEAPGAAAEASTEAALLERLLGRSPSEPARPGAGVADDFIRKVVAPHVVRGPDPREADVAEALERGASDLMRALMHHPDFQALEANWRGLDLLVRSLELDEGLSLFILDASKEALDPAELRRFVIDERGGPSGAAPFSVIACAHAFAPTAEDAERLARIGAIAAEAGAPFLATAEHQAFLAGASSEAFRALRARPEARSLGLVGPRFLLRSPYGPGMEEAERFRFVEQPAPPDPAGYLWGPPAFLAACLLGRSFVESGWSLSPEQNLAFDGLPVHTYRVDGEPVQTPCAELWLTSASVDALLAGGVMPLQSVRGRDEVRLARFQSLAEPLAPLAARFGG
jgi:type VI secretion system protein ImpC